MTIIGFHDPLFHRFPITQDQIDFNLVKRRYEDPGTKRICFQTCHQNALKESSDPRYIGTFNIPFPDTVYPIFQEKTQLRLFPDRFQRGGLWRYFNEESDYQTVQEFIRQFGLFVFLRDGLCLSLAISEHMEGPGDNPTRTKFGEWERGAKYDQDTKSVQKLARACSYAIQRRLPYYKDVDAICAVPPSPGKPFHLPDKLVTIIKSRTSIQNISSKVRFKNRKPPLKDKPIEERWEILEKAKLEVSVDLSNKAVLVLDDMYHSGTTMQYVGMKLQEAGAARILGMALVKSRRDNE